ncbi:MAG: bifunctional DNA primase/polymerase [Candidatus Hydrogenedentes bacterium]|nr:bifunctional DNA primase/polymerase [Candidatus Hydrogenedentota bacterium]
MSESADNNAARPRWNDGELDDYVERGWAFTFVEGKKPNRRGWQRETPLDIGVLRRYRGNLGVRTGEVSGIVVIDFDDMECLEGYAELLPETVEAISGGGGRHFYYRYAKPAKGKAKGKAINGADIKADGGCIVFPGSRHPETGNLYEWAPGHSPNEIELAELPEWIAVLVTPTEKSKPTAMSRAANNKGAVKYCETALANECQSVCAAAEHTRNNTLNEAAFKLGGLVASRHLDQETVIGELLRAALACGLPEHEARATIKSGLDGGKANPREIPEREPPVVKPEGKYKARMSLSNFLWVKGEDGKPRKQGQRLTDISANLFRITGAWPKRVGKLLFYDDGGTIRFLETCESLCAWIGERCDLQWGSGAGVGSNQLTPKSEFYAHLQYAAESFEAVESLPHEPRITTSYYAWCPPAGYTPTGDRLAALLQFFDNTENPADRDLIMAAFLTPAWGGLPGTRPAIAITAPDRGCGKTTLAEAIGELYGGICQIQPHGNEENVVSRLLSPDCLLTRVVSIDNIKNGLSSALLESLITTAVISGHRWYHGEARRENNLTWVLTANCLRLSRDLSDRSFFIRLRKPSPTPDWRERLFTFIRKNRHEIIADIIHELLRQPCTHTARDRWQSWVDGVLARVTNDPLAVVELNQKRRDQHDDDLEQAADIWDALKIEPSEYSDGFLPSSRVLAIVNRALGVVWKTKTLANVIDGHIEAGRLPGVSRGRKTAGKGYYILRNRQNEQVES